MAGPFGSMVAVLEPAPAALVGSGNGISAAGANTVTLPTGTVVGDMVLLFGNTAGGAPTFGGTSTGSWTTGIVSGGGFDVWYAYKRLADLGTVTITPSGGANGLYHVLSVRNVYGINVKQSASLTPSGSAASFTGFTKAATHLGAVAVMGAQQGANSANTFSINSGFSTDKYTTSATGPNATAQNLLTTHHLTYTSGVGPTVSGIGATSVQVLFLELLSS